MDRALDPNLLGGALGDIGNLPTPDQLRQMLAEAEVSAFFAQAQDLPGSLLDLAWVLHQVGTVRPALQIYQPERQVQANAVAAHIFDLALARGLPEGDTLVTTFAAQVSSIRGDRSPNATALGARLPEPSALLRRDPGRASLELGCSLLSLTQARTRNLLRRHVFEMRLDGPDDASFDGTPLAAAVGVLRGSRFLLDYLRQGDARDLASARDLYERAANDPASRRDLDSRWVAAHLLDLVDDLGQSSVWAVLPANTPPGVGLAMTHGEPPVLTLWPPQITLLRDDEHNPMRPTVRRSVMTFPTSAGKTLLTQLVVVNHLLTENTPVCVVAPSHSLCREIRSGLDRRLWVMRKNVAEDGPLGDPGKPRASVVVMTPERLAARLRTNSAELLNEFGLFILDEAHLVADDSRGWTFETTISRLHQLTATTEHRIIVVSAALGGTATVRTWLGVDSPPATLTARWRGPRRLHATYHTQENGPVRTIPPEGRQRLPREVQELWGVVRLYVDAGEATAVRGGPIGDIVTAGKTTTRPSHAKQHSLIVNLAARAGSVLTVHATKNAAERLAQELASQRDTREPTALVRLAEQRLGGSHPLVDVLRRGIAYHHAALPVDIQIEVENAVRAGEIDVVCATTTLAEGVNLPVRTVFIAERGYYDGSEYVPMIDVHALLNAAGRAGRAGRETEGWVIIAHQPYAPNARAALLGLDADQDVHSTLNTTGALEALGTYEALITETIGLVFDDIPQEVDAFLGYCWYLAEAASALDPAALPGEVLAGLRATLAWQQLTPGVAARWEALAQHAIESFKVTSPERRRRWAQTGTRLSSNVVLESVSMGAQSGAVALPWEDTVAPLPVLEMLLADGRLSLLLSLLPERDRRFKRKRYGKTQLIDVEMGSLVLDWVTGLDLAGLAERYLADVEDDAFRFEQLASFLTKVCEHHLPWTLAIVIDWVKQDTGVELCPTLPSHLHFGVPTASAITLMLGGVRSRRLAVIIGNRAQAEGVPEENLRAWLARMGVAAWRAEFSAAPAEVADLLQYVRNPASNIGQTLLEGASVEVKCTFTGDTLPAGDVALSYLIAEEAPPPLVVVDDFGGPLGQLDPAVHHDLSLLIDAGFQLRGTVIPEEGVPSLRVRLEGD